MKKTVLLLFILFQMNLYSQSCLPEGIHFKNQQQIDQFSQDYPYCKRIEGPVLIGDFSATDSISSLEGLSQLTSFGDELGILGNSNLSSLIGLESVQSIDGQFGLYYNSGLLNVDGLQSLNTIGGALVISNNHNLTNLEKFSSLESINEDLGIYQNTSLENLNGFEHLTYVHTFIDIVYNENLLDISGINNIDPESITMSVEINNNPLLSLCSNQFICDFMSLASDSLLVSFNNQGCGNLFEIHSNCDTTSVINLEFEEDIVIYPNPTNRYLSFKLSQENNLREVAIYDMSGRKVFTRTDNNTTIDLSALNNGVFIVELVFEKSATLRKLFVKE